MMHVSSPTPCTVTIIIVASIVPIADLLTIAFAMSLPLQIHLINVSVTKNDALYHIPAFFVLWNLLSILSSAAVYEEIRITAESWAILVAGVACLFVGVALVASRGV